MIRKFRATVQEHHLIHKSDTVVVGVSGGPDSLVLLHALRTLAPDLELKLHVAHLNHQLRNGESDADEQFVLWLAREWALPVATASWDVRGYAEENGLSIEEAARNLRYQFLLGVANQVQANAIAVAHNADDQVETILLHFLRGAGLSGLRGMAYKTSIQSSVDGHPVPLVRPLLDVSRAEIEIYCVENNLQPREDASNQDVAYLRNRLRHNVIPYLETINPNFREVLRHSALSIADDYDYIHQNVLGIFDRMTRADENTFVFDRKWFRALPVNLQRGVLREAVSRLRQLKNIGYTHIENARRVALEKDAGAEASLPQGLLLVVGYDDFTVGEHIPLPDAPLLMREQVIPLRVGDEIWLEESDWGVRVRERGMGSGEREAGNGERGGGIDERPLGENREAGVGEPVTGNQESVPGNGTPETGDRERNGTRRWVAQFDADKVRGQLVLRARKPGERFAPRGMRGKHKSLHEFMIDDKIPRHLREFVPVLADKDKILWVVGYRADERASVNAETKNMIQVEFFKGLE